MKKNIFTFVIIVVMIVLSSCSNNLSKQSPTSIHTESKNAISSGEISISELTNTNNKHSSDIGGGDLGLLKYRMNYYTIPAPFAKIVDSASFEEWYGEILLSNPNETNVMMMKEFVLEFGVTRENFEKANLEWAKIVKNNLDGNPIMNPKDFSNQETDEIYNADIIYTFDDETINNYYLSHDYPYAYWDEYEAALANGTYQTQTTDWIDIEQMEAEIIAKYGEAEIVPETATVPKETEAIA